MGGNCFLVRYADDFVMGFSVKSDAERVYPVLPQRFERFGLSIHPDKSRMVQFSRPYWKQGKGPGSFAFLGFTHYWGKTLSGGWTLKRNEAFGACLRVRLERGQTGARASCPCLVPQGQTCTLHFDQYRWGSRCRGHGEWSITRRSPPNVLPGKLETPHVVSYPQGNCAGVIGVRP